MKNKTTIDYKQAIELTGGLSKPSKMPCPSYSIPASLCKTGSKLAKVKNSVCEGCYALKGFYRMPNVQRSLKNRFNKILKPEWVNAMALLIKSSGTAFMRFHDSGDLQSVKHLKQIAQVARKTKDVKFWMPSREFNIIKEYKL